MGMKRKKTHKAICLYWLSHWNFCSNIILWLFSKLILIRGGITLHFIWCKEFVFFASHNFEYDLYNLYMVFTFVCRTCQCSVCFIGKIFPSNSLQADCLTSLDYTPKTIWIASSVTYCLSSHQSFFWHCILTIH